MTQRILPDAGRQLTPCLTGCRNLLNVEGILGNCQKQGTKIRVMQSFLLYISYACTKACSVLVVYGKTCEYSIDW